MVDLPPADGKHAAARRPSQQTDGRLPGSSEFSTAAMRIIDANGNRAGEGLRVVEDFARFVLDDAQLTERCKLLRHELSTALALLPESARLRARETTADVGVSIATADEYQRSNPGHIAAANLRRSAEALRSIEEYAKLASPELARRAESIRYQTYTLQRMLGIRLSGREKLADARLYVLLDGRGSPNELQSLAAALIAAGVDVLQLRDKQLSDRELLERARILRELTADGQTLLIVNDRPDIAALSQADGVHVGQGELRVKDARTIVGPQMLVGVSTHSLSQVEQATLDGADYVGCGPVFASRTKDFAELAGVQLLAEAVAANSLPAFAIGGISRENLPQVLATGFSRIAVSSAIIGAADPGAAARELKKMLVASQNDANQGAAALS